MKKHVQAKLEEQKQKQAARHQLSRWRDRVKSDFQVDLQFQLPLPEVPLGPRFLRVDPLASLSSLVEYRDTLPLATRFRYECAGDVTMGITVDTVDSKKWNPPTVESGPNAAAGGGGGGRRAPLHADDAAILEWDRFVQGKRCVLRACSVIVACLESHPTHPLFRHHRARRGMEEEGEDDHQAIAAAAAADAPWMLRPLYETAVTYEKVAVKAEEGDGGYGRGEEMDVGAGAGGEGEEDEGTADGWRTAVERTFEEAEQVGSAAGLLEPPQEGMQPEWVAPVVPNLGQWASDLVVAHFGNELRGREEEAAQEAPLFLLEEAGELEHGTTRRAGYHRGPRQDPEVAGVGGLYTEAYAPVRYYDLVVERLGVGAGAGAGAEQVEAASAASGQQQLLLLLEPGGRVSMCPTLGNVRLKKPSRASGARPPRGVKLRHRALAEEEKERRELKLMNAGIDDEAAAEGRQDD